MNQLERRVRETLQRQAGGSTVRSVPDDLVRRVRWREVRFASAVAAIVAVSVVAGVALSQLLPHGTADHTRFASDGYPSPLENVPPGWPAVEISDPADAYVPPIADDAKVVDGPVVLASGDVEGSAFTLYAYTVREDGGRTPCLGFVGFAEPGADLRTAADVGTCASRPAVPAEQDVAFIGAGPVPTLSEVTANFGFVSERVDRIDVWGGGGSGMFRIPILEPLRGWDVAPFFLVPSAGAGPLEVVGRGSVLASADVCHGDIVIGTCRTEVAQLAPVGGPLPGEVSLDPGAWPDVVVGGGFEPYVDHEVNLQGVRDPGVVGEKVPIAWGTVEGIPWSLTAFAVDGGGGWTGSAGPDGEPGPAGQLFLGAGGRYGGTGLGLYGMTPWHPNDLGLTSAGFGTPGLTAYAGVASSRVAGLELRFEDGERRTVELIDGPIGIDAHYFVVWAPNGLAGEALAIDTDGRVIQRERLCVPDLRADATSVCG